MITRTFGTETFAFSYDQENRLNEVSGDAEVSFVYDGDGKMVKRVTEDLVTIYIGGYFEVDIKPYVVHLPLVMRDAISQTRSAPLVTPGVLTGDPYPGPEEGGESYLEMPETKSSLKDNLAMFEKAGFLSQATITQPPPNQTWRSYYFVGGKRIAMRVQEGSWRNDTYFLLSDHLGSTTATIDSNGDKTAEMRYSPWGSVRLATGSQETDYTYTGQLSQVGNFGLLFFNARWMDPSLGRFTSPDILVPNPQNVLDWDRYQYVRSNSLRYSDPSGHYLFEEEPDDSFVWISEKPYDTLILSSEPVVDWEETQKPNFLVPIIALYGPAVGYTFIEALFSDLILNSAAAIANYLCIDGDCGNEIQATSKVAKSIWDLSPFKRGFGIEKLLGGNLPPNYPVIDYWNKATGLVRSIKSINLQAATYQTISRLIGTVQGYINTLANWSGNQNWAGVKIQSGEIATRELLLAIPLGATQEQLNALYQLQHSALEQGIILTLVTIP
jgi:RHS repeat-associated protein